ncbi:uncharacterized protein LOC129575682 [Sitodiplosis mosellana]|uniref:uncharacterized protein LOC129575682 n=1 Tax=Sitodiplosis mosellana TaxID=263140 RepID=UPI002443E1D6|nr:uncharacterized protein LOC129575682 [Sitodiplosis mosellana]XP_055315585.1 uncharacterized protein LOC129575682 [Sitodiplosis mosellana]XP_055315594.1 uncharacterized protein LOC129575682 [Sitodiplosis mosellana]
MSSKLCYFLIVLICGQACQISGRQIVRRDVPNHQNMVPTKELTDEDIAKMKQEMAAQLTPAQLKQFGEILTKFKKGATPTDFVEGMVQLLVLAVAVGSNATDTDITKLFNEDVQTTTLGSIAENRI